MGKKKKKFWSFSKAEIRKGLLKIVLLGMVVLAFMLFVLVLLVRFGAFETIPNHASLKQIRNNTATEIISVDERLLGRYYFQNRTNTSIKDIPQSFINALVATEDARFYKHNGVDNRSMVRVAIKSILLANRSSGGGSTITQQLVKNLYPRKDHGIFSMPVAKIKEMVVAKRLEALYSKDEILELYLNTVPFGENTFGIETASLVFFNKEPAELQIEESAMLVGLLKGNNYYNPRKKSEAAILRRNVVIEQMVRNDFLDKAKGDSLKKLPIALKYQKLSHDEGPAAYFREYLRLEATKILDGIKKPDGTTYNLYADGLKIYTTINASMQHMAEASVNEHLAALQKIFDRHWKGQEPWKKDPLVASLQIEQSQPYQNMKNSGKSMSDIINEMRKARKTSVFSWAGKNDTLMSPLDSVLHHFQILQTRHDGDEPAKWRYPGLDRWPGLQTLQIRPCVIEKTSWVDF
jgi:penicillin-binding protein 1A